MKNIITKLTRGGLALGFILTAGLTVTPAAHATDTQTGGSNGATTAPVTTLSSCNSYIPLINCTPIQKL